MRGFTKPITIKLDFYWKEKFAYNNTTLIDRNDTLYEGYYVKVG